MKTRGVIFSIMTVVLFGCTSPKQEDFVGTWRGDGIELQLRADGTCSAIGKNGYLLLEDETPPSDNPSGISGRWKTDRCNCCSEYIALDLVNNDTGRENGQQLFFNRRLSWSRDMFLYIILGDPDDLNRVELDRVENKILR